MVLLSESPSRPNGPYTQEMARTQTRPSMAQLFARLWPP
jgi:hypothetical protein